MKDLEILYLVLMVVFMLTILVFFTSFILNSIFLRRNYKKLLERGFNSKFEIFDCEYSLICDFFNFAIGTFEIYYMNDDITILKIKENYFGFNGSDLTFLFNLNDSIDEKVHSFLPKKKND